jgi:hypothetical protein
VIEPYWNLKFVLIFMPLVAKNATSRSEKRKCERSLNNFCVFFRSDSQFFQMKTMDPSKGPGYEAQTLKNSDLETTQFENWKLFGPKKRRNCWTKKNQNLKEKNFSFWRAQKWEESLLVFSKLFTNFLRLLFG